MRAFLRMSKPLVDAEPCRREVRPAPRRYPVNAPSLSGELEVLPTAGDASPWMQRRGSGRCCTGQVAVELAVDEIAETRRRIIVDGASHERVVQRVRRRFIASGIDSSLVGLNTACARV